MSIFSNFLHFEYGALNSPYQQFLPIVLISLESTRSAYEGYTTNIKNGFVEMYTINMRPLQSIHETSFLTLVTAHYAMIPNSSLCNSHPANE